MKNNSPAIISVFHLLFILMLVMLCRNAAMGDWGNYYYGSKLFASGEGIKAYDIDNFNHFAEVYGHEKTFLSYTQVPPLSQVFYYPFSLLPVGAGKLVFILMSYVLCFFSVRAVFKKLKIDFAWTLALPLFFFLACRSNVEQGQAYFLLVALLGFGWLARENGKLIVAGLLFALAIHLKIFPGIILLWLLAEKDWRTFGITVCLTVCLFLISLLCIDWETWHYYLTVILPRLSKGEITNTYATTYQSMQVLLKQLFVPDALHNPGAPFNSAFAFRFLNLLWMGIIFTAALLFSLDKRQNSFTRFSFWLFAGMLISGYGSVYGLLLLVFPAIAIIANETILLQRKVILLAIIALICNLPVGMILHLPLPFSFLRLFLTVILFGLLLYAIRPRWNKIALLGFMILAGLLVANQQEQGSHYFLSKEPSLLVTDFSVSGDSILYDYRDEDGIHRSSVKFPEHISEVENKQDAHYYIYIYDPLKDYPGEQVGKRVIINKKYQLYLSDRNRGPGFTTLRIKEIAGK